MVVTVDLSNTLAIASIIFKHIYYTNQLTAVSIGYCRALHESQERSKEEALTTLRYSKQASQTSRNKPTILRIETQLNLF